MGEYVDEEVVANSFIYLIHLAHPTIHHSSISSIHSFIHSPIYTSIHSSIYPSIYLIHLFIHSLFIHLFIHLYVHSFIHLSIYPSISSFIYTSLYSSTDQRCHTKRRKCPVLPSKPFTASLSTCSPPVSGALKYTI